MSPVLLDTDVFSQYRRGDESIIVRVNSLDMNDVAITVITAEEVVAGWFDKLRKAKTRAQTAAAYEQIATTIERLSGIPVVTFTEAAIIRYETLKSFKLNVGGNDMRIAAIAMEMGATVATRNVRDFGRIPGLSSKTGARNNFLASINHLSSLVIN